MCLQTVVPRPDVSKACLISSYVPFRHFSLSESFVDGTFTCDTLTCAVGTDLAYGGERAGETWRTPKEPGTD